MPKPKQAPYSAGTNGGSISELMKELWQAAVNLRGSIEPSDYKRYVLPVIFLRFLSLRYEKRHAALKRMIAEPQGEYYQLEYALDDPPLPVDKAVAKQQDAGGCGAERGDRVDHRQPQPVLERDLCASRPAEDRCAGG